jgi:cytochrome c oxidase subunit 2
MKGLRQRSQGFAIPLALLLLLIAVAVIAGTLWWVRHHLPTRIADTAYEVDGIILFVLAVAGIFLFFSQLYLAFVLSRFRDNPKATFVGVTRRSWLPVLAVLAVLFAFDLMFDHKSNEVWGKVFFRIPNDAFVVEITGEQFAWSIRYPGKDGKLGRSDVRLITDDNPLGLDKNDPASKDDIVFPAGQGELHLPLNHPVLFLIRSKDTLHSFFIPFARLKMDAVLGMTTRLWFVPIKPGRYEFTCAELCGLGHYRMRGDLIVEPMEKVQEWLSQQPTFEETMP